MVEALMLENPSVINLLLEVCAFILKLTVVWVK